MAHLAPLLLALCCVVSLDAYRFYQDRIPNGDRVPHPCQPNILWEGVGHKNIAGGEDRNPFGEDFDVNGKIWNKCICERDSDGDGKTNGEELGDPNCAWTEGAIPEKVTGLSHPGICEPLDDPICLERNDWSFCEYNDDFECDAIQNKTDVKEIIVRFPNTSVPAQETTYWCMTFELPHDQEYHLIADRPLIDNKNIMHHIIVYGCDEPASNDTSWQLTSPTECGMSQQVCRTALSLWTVGVYGSCLPEEYGFRVGLNGFRYVTMQFHWNNPELNADYYDNSGMALYLTPNLRANDAAILTVGNLFLDIPPQMDTVSQVGHCHAGCTRHIQHALKISELGFHMHYLGYSASLEHIRDGKILKLIEQKTYSYDNPGGYRYDDPIEFKPGDEMKLTCNFKSKTKKTVTYYGDATSDEMCLAFLTYYPARDDFTTCASYKSLDLCERRVGGEIEIHPVGNCNYTIFLAPENIGVMIGEIMATCVNPAQKCPEGCQEVLDKYNQDPCFQGDLGLFTQYNIIQRYVPNGKDLVALLHSCDEEWDRSIIFREDLKDPNLTIDKTNTTTPRPSSDGKCVFDPIAAGVSATTASFLILVVAGLLSAQI